MNSPRRDATRLAVVIVAAVACQSSAGAPVAPPSAAPSPARPNIVFILTDDMDMSPLPYMPILKAALADRGTSFSNMFVTDPVCCPSRASILTGLYVHNHGVIDNKPPSGGYRVFVEKGNEQRTVALWLKAAGYRTALIGKYINRYPGWKDETHVPPGWDDWQALFFPENYGNYLMNDNGRTREYGEAKEDYQTDVLTTRSLDFLSRTGPAQPFFLYLAPFAPHSPADPAGRHENLFPGLKAPRPPSFNEEDVSDKPEWVRKMPRMDADLIAKTDDWHRRRVQTLQAVDEMVGRIVGALQMKGQLANTYIFFTSDNGFELGAHRLDHGKADPYDDSTRVPLIIRGPGVPEGRTLDHYVLNIDFAPTFAALAGATAPPTLDGRSIVPLLGAKPPLPKDWRKDFLVEHWDSGKHRQRETEDDGGIPEYAILRTSEYVYTEYPSTGERELYDIHKDPYELQSLHQTASPKLLRSLSERLAVLRKCSGEGCR